MNSLNDSLDDSALFCKSIIQKRKASSNINPKNPKQLKLNFSIKTSKDNERREGVDNMSTEEQNHNCNRKEIGPLSSYFQQKRTLNICPLCMKSFKTDSAYSTHMKQCAKSHKMTTQQLLDALELQKQQMQQGRDLGLPVRSVSTAKKIPSKKREEKERDSYDLALGLALSKSLSNHKSNPAAISETKKSTLQQFGITSNHIAEPCRRKNEGRRKSILKFRTAEDRQRIIIEKLGVILLDEEQGPGSGGQKQSSNPSFHCDQLASLVNMSQHLWNLGENDSEKLDWYVDGMKTLMRLREGSDKDNNKETILSSDLESEISKLYLPQERVHNSWKKMINSSEFSDVIGKTKDCQNFHLHSVVLFARFPEILKKDYESAFEKYNLSTILIFLEYLYCGTLNSLVKEEIENLQNLATALKYAELIEILNRLESNLSKCCKTLSFSSGSGNSEMERKDLGKTGVENKKAEFFEGDLFAEENVVDLTQSSSEAIPYEINGDTSETESNTEKSYRSFLQREKEIEELEEMKEARTSAESKNETMQKILSGIEEEEEEGMDLIEEYPAEKIQDQPRRVSDDSATKDLTDEFKLRNTRRSSDCIILSSGSESHESMTKENFKKSPCDRSRASSPIDSYEVPYFDPYDNFHCFSEEQFSPADVHSQSLITGDISSEPLRLPDAAVSETPKEEEEEEEEVGVVEEEPKKNLGYCSTPVTMRHSFRVKSSTKGKSERSRKRRSDLSASRILRKSLGLELKMKNKKSSAFQKKSAKKDEDVRKNDFAELLTGSILNELSKSDTLKSSTPVRVRNFVEITPIMNKEEFGESVTPSPNYSNMEEALLKEHLSKYGLKKNLGKIKARKILRHIYEELHPLYNTETGKIVKIITTNKLEARKKAKPKGKLSNKNVKPKQGTKCRSKRSKNKEVNSPKETLTDGSVETLEGSIGHDASGSDFENLSETLTQTVPSNPIDLPSAFAEFLENNPEYHTKILLYEPIWLEELQKKLKESFKKHFKISDLMDYLDQKCITFRSAAQVKKGQKKLEKKKPGGKEVLADT